MNTNGKSTEKQGVLVKTSLVDYPGLVSCAFFLKNCNLRCPYCYNRGLIFGENENEEENYSSLDELFSHLEKRKNVIKGFVLSGGEPLLNPKTPEILSFAKKTGYKVKLDTNGTLPEKLKTILENPETSPDYIACDIKTNPDKYFEKLLPHKNSFSLQESENLASKIRKTIGLLSSLPTEKYEFRTVLVPTLIDENDIKILSTLLPSKSKWFFAHFQNHNCLNPSYNEKLPFSREEEEFLLTLAKKKIKGAEIR